MACYFIVLHYTHTLYLREFRLALFCPRCILRVNYNITVDCSCTRLELQLFCGIITDELHNSIAVVCNLVSPNIEESEPQIQAPDPLTRQRLKPMGSLAWGWDGYHLLGLKENIERKIKVCAACQLTWLA